MSRRTEDFVSPLVREMPPSGIRRFFDLVANTRGVISLGVGEPDFVTPWHVREAAIYSLERGYTMYTSNFGIPELRREVAAYLERSYDLSYDPDSEIIITVGASEAVDLALRAVVTQGDEVLVPEPCYVSYRPCAALAGGTPVTVATKPEDDFRVTPGVLLEAISPRSKVFVSCYPNNPTGGVMETEDWMRLTGIFEEHDLLVIADEIYSELTYGGKHASLAAFPGMQKRVVLVNGFSKAFAMTGWRVGFAAGPREIINAMVKIHQYTMLCAPVMGQMAALEALRHGEDEMKRMVVAYDRRRRMIFKRICDMGLSCFEPRGAFYIFPSIKKTGFSSDEFCERFLAEEKVALVPGTAFGASGEGHVRISYAASLQNLTEAMNRLERFINRHG